MIILISLISNHLPWGYVNCFQILVPEVNTYLHI